MSQSVPSPETPPPPRPVAPRRSRDSRRSRSQRPLYRFGTWVGPTLLSFAIRVLARTLRVEFSGTDELFGRWERGEQVIVAFWHNRLLLMPIAYRGRRLCVLNSAHRDGDLAARALTGWRIRAVRGSATRGGVGGFLQLLRAFREGDDLAVVPDGPRGPRYEVKPGVIHLARATGAPIYPASWAAARMRQLQSWDRLVIPLPFTRVHFIIAAPLSLDRHAGDEQVEAARAELQARLNRITAVAEERAGRRAA